MKILLSALACNPVTGSEAAVGWTVASALARRHEVHVLTHEHNRPFFDEWLKTHALPESLRVHYFGESKTCHPNRMIARIGSWRDSQSWQWNLLQPARELHRRFGFDLTHHVTYATWRVASPLWQLPIPFVWGPLGGGELFPWNCSGVLSPTSLAFEIARSTSNFLSRHNAAVRDCAKKSRVCVAGNRETFDVLKHLRETENGIARLCVSFFPGRQIEDFAKLLPARKPSEHLHLFAGGNLEGRKGVAIALQALAKVKSRGVSFTYRLAGDGPEASHLKKIAAQLGLGENVIFGYGLPGDAYRRELIKTDIYLLPSLRDNSGRTLMEAMLAGCVPIVADCGGPGEIVTGECGFRVALGKPQTMADEIADAILKLHSDREMMLSKSTAAHRRIATGYSEESYLQSIGEIYSETLKIRT